MTDIGYDDTLENIEQDVRELKAQFARHEERHGDEADMLGRVLDSLSEHTRNHHGKASTMKQGSAVGAAVALLYVVVELIRQFAL
jgi:hypothetical protein